MSRALDIRPLSLLKIVADTKEQVELLHKQVKRVDLLVDSKEIQRRDELLHEMMANKGSKSKDIINFEKDSNWIEWVGFLLDRNIIMDQSAGLRMFGSDIIKLDRMDGMNFTHWKEKMKFLLTAFKVYYVLEGPPVGVMTKEEQRKREQDETLCRGYILKKYTAEKEGADKFITFKFFEFAMEDNVSILDQVNEFLILVSKFKNLNIEIPEKLLVGAIITKLPSSWRNYRKKLMHTSEDFTLDQIQKNLRIEEETRIREKNLNDASGSKVNYVDSGKNNKGNDKKRKGTWNSSKNNHFLRLLEQVDTTEITVMVSEMNIGMIRELHMASVTTTDDWWYDSGATTHVCNNKDLFKTYKETADGHEVMMGDNHTSKVIGSGNVEIQFTSGKKLTLMNVLYVLNIRKNLVSGFKLCKSGVKAVIESDKVILSKANVFVGKAYACDGMFKLNINKITSSAYLPDCNFISSFNIECSTFNLWHNRLGHINYRTMKDMLKQGIISYNGEHKDKCEICVQAKMKRKPFPKVDRQSEILELVHSDICELNGQLTRGGNRQLALYYDRFPAVLEGYLDASWITGSSDSKSTTGWIFTLGGRAVCWGSKKQTCITHSTMEAEFLALAAAGKEAEWLRNMLLDIELWPQPMPSISLHCDSQSTLSRTYNKMYNGKSRHISLRHAYIKELISNGIITIEYIRSCKNLANPFTKVFQKTWSLELQERWFQPVVDLLSLLPVIQLASDLIHQRTAPYTPQQNGVAERKNRVLQDMINAMLVSAILPKNLWGEALLIACHISLRINFVMIQQAQMKFAPRRSERARKERNLDPDFIDSQAIIFLVEGDNENNVINKIPVLLNVEDAPKTYKEAITSRNSAFWKEAIDDEMDSLVSNNTWELSDLPPGSKAIGCRWVFRIKYHTDGSVQTFKARLVIQGFSQRQGVDYFDTYAPVARITSIRVLFALASIYNLPIHQMDVKTA
ncbi:zinc finger, CCHC-type containing protein, partial [Tanacetum coccineum]